MNDATIDDFIDDDPPPARFTCLICDKRYFDSETDLYRHVNQRHSVRRVTRKALPINAPRPLADEFSQRIVDGECPVCGTVVKNDTGNNLWHTLAGHTEDKHSSADVYHEFREALPDGYDHSPTYDDNGKPDPQGTALVLVPSDTVTITVEGWQSSHGTTPHRAPRARQASDETWTFEGIVQSVDDARDRVRKLQQQHPDADIDPEDVLVGSGKREVVLMGDAEIWDDDGEESTWILQTYIYSDNASVKLRKAPEIGMDMSAGGYEPLNGRVETIDRTPGTEHEP